MKRIAIAIFFMLAAQAHAGAYVGGNVGGYLYDEDLDGSGLDDVEVRDWTAGAQAGYMFTNWIGVEGWYQHYFEGSETIEGIAEIEGEGSLFGVAVRPALRISDDFELYAKLGLGFWDADVDVEVPGLPETEFDDDGTDFIWGFGGRWWGGKHWSLGLEFTRLEADSEVQFDNVTFNAAYHF